MTVTDPIHPTTALPAPSGAGPRATRGGAVTGFARAMSAAHSAVEAEAKRAEHEAGVRQAAEQLVSTTFIMPLFEQLRSDPLAANMFHGGRGESVFQQQLDQELSDRIASGAGFDLVDAVAAEFGVTGKTARPTRAPAVDAAAHPPAVAMRDERYG
jgi:Rod binding domain-containing protein